MLTLAAGMPENADVRMLWQAAEARAERAEASASQALQAERPHAIDLTGEASQLSRKPRELPFVSTFDREMAKRHAARSPEEKALLGTGLSTCPAAQQQLSRLLFFCLFEKRLHELGVQALITWTFSKTSSQLLSARKQTSHRSRYPG